MNKPITKQHKMAFAAFLVELSMLRTKLNIPQTIDPNDIDSLRNGIEPVIDKYLTCTDLITYDQISKVEAVLRKVNEQTIRGYYDIEPELKEIDIDRSTAHAILSYFQSNGKYTTLIKKFDSEYSPMECRKFMIM